MAEGMAIGTKMRKSGGFSDNGNVLGDSINESDTVMLRKAWPVGRSLVEIQNSILNGVRNPVVDMELCENILEDLLAGGLEAVISH